MYTSNLPIIFLLLLVGHRTISNTLELDTAQDAGKKKTIENRTVGKMPALLKNAVRTLLGKCRFTPFKTFVIRIPRVTMNKLPMV